MTFLPFARSASSPARRSPRSSRCIAGASLFVGNDSGPGPHGGRPGSSRGGDLRRLGSGHLGPVAHRIGSGDGARRRGAGARRAGAPAGGRMTELLRLLAYARRYWASLAASVVLMAAAGGATAMMALLIGPIFDRVLNRLRGQYPGAAVHRPDLPPPLLSQQFRALFHRQRLDHGGLRHPGGFPDQGCVRLLRQLPGQLRGLLRGNQPAGRGVRQGAEAGRGVL